jgi:hypothetical protein
MPTSASGGSVLLSAYSLAEWFEGVGIRDDADSNNSGVLSGSAAAVWRENSPASNKETKRRRPSFSERRV